MSRLNVSSRPDGWTLPRMPHDASLRYHQFGPIRPMIEPQPVFSRGFVFVWMVALFLLAVACVLIAT